MVKNETTSAEIVKDAGLRAWIQTATDQVCDVIVEAALPPRRVTFQRQASGEVSPQFIDPENAPDREALLSELDQELREIVGGKKTRVLKAAGAIVVRATAEEIQAIAKKPLVKAIRPNRRLK